MDIVGHSAKGMSVARSATSMLCETLGWMPDASFLIDGSGRIVAFNIRAEEMFGYARGEVLGKSIDVLIPERFRPLHAGRCSSYVAGPRPRSRVAALRLHASRKNGTEFPVEICLNPIDADDNDFVVGAIRDVSHSEEHYRTLFAQAAIGVVHVNNEGRLLDVNPKFCEIAGYTRDEVLALNIRALAHADDLAETMAAHARILCGAAASDARKLRLIGKDGRVNWAHITTSLMRGSDGRPMHFISFVQDISAYMRAENERRETELRFRQVTDNIREVFWLTDPGKNEVLYVSPAYEAIWGRTTESIYLWAREWLDAVHPDDRERVRDAALTDQTTGGYSEEYRIVRPDGTVRWIRDRAFPVHDSTGTVIRVAGVAEDVTETKRSADALRESERRFRNMLQNVELISLMLDCEGNITYCNDYLLELTGWKRDEVIGGNWLKLFLPPAKHTELQGVFKSLVEELPHAWHYENEILTRTGERRLVRWNNTTLRSASGAVVGTASIGEDITERRRAESALKESEGRFRAMIEQSISGTCIIDDKRYFAYVNPRLAAILGYESAAPIIGQPILNFVASKDHATVAENVRQRLAGEPQSVCYHFEAIRKDGSMVTLGVHGSTGYYGGERVVIATVQDVTELRRAEEEVERTVTKLRRAVQSTIEVVSTMGELRDAYTHGHAHRVGEVATAIAIELGLDCNRVEGVRVAGYLHDVGKIAVPAEILAKPKRLSPIEFELVKEHAQQSYEILKGMESPWPIAEAAWQHHERCDGSGYPRGLKGDEILLEARILAVADTVEAIASPRPYRASLGIDVALAEVENNRGKLYDGEVVDACLRLFREKGYRLPG